MKAIERDELPDAYVYGLNSDNLLEEANAALKRAEDGAAPYDVLVSLLTAILTLEDDDD